jgi:uncharacterized membrane protein YgaE (UPF0421/DUF939 family)
VASQKTPKWWRVTQADWIHAARTSIAALISLVVARLFRLPEAYWAAITTIIVTQSTLGAALTVSKQRLAGTAIGAVLGALTATYVGSNAMAFAGGVFMCGLICSELRIEQAAYRYAGITLAIVMLAVRTEAPWIIAIHRFLEISIGIAVALILTALWPERKPASP